ncbi:hypothetical protein ACVWYN_001129 [Pedobacter sp. UYP24]
MKVLKIFPILFLLNAAVYAQGLHSNAVDSIRNIFSEAINTKAFTDTIG